MTALQSATLANNDDFIKRVRVLGCKAAVAVSSEPYGGEGQPTAAQHNLRISYANRFLLNSEAQAILLAWGVVSGGVITAESSDSDVEFTINSIFDAFAGVVPASLTPAV